MVLQLKDRHCEPETCNMVLVKADAFKGKRKVKDRWEEDTWRWCIGSWQTSPLTKWQTNMDSHASSTETAFFLSCQRLAFPCVQASVIHGTGVPAPPHASPPLQEVKVRLHHKRVLVVWSPNALPAKLPWGGLIRSYDFYCGYPLKHPLKMGEDFG